MSAPRASAQSAAATGARASAFCRAPDALTVFASTIRHVLRAQPVSGDWPVFQVPCDRPARVVDVTTNAILVVDRASTADQDILQYGFAPAPFLAPADVPRQADDPFARLGRWILRPDLSAVPSVWSRGPLGPSGAEALRLAVGAGAVQALAGLADGLCGGDGTSVPRQLLTIAETLSRNHPDYHLYFDAALNEHRALTGEVPSVAPWMDAVRRDLDAAAVPQLRCDLANRERFSLMPIGPGATSLGKAADHIRRALDSLRSNGRSDLGQLNLARACVRDALADMHAARRPPSCRASEYGLWTRAYVPLLHAAQVKVLQTSR